MRQINLAYHRLLFVFSVTIERDYDNPNIQIRHNMKTVLVINRLLKGIVRSPKSKKRLHIGSADNKTSGWKDKN